MEKRDNVLLPQSLSVSLLLRHLLSDTEKITADLQVKIRCTCSHGRAIISYILSIETVLVLYKITLNKGGSQQQPYRK